QWYSGGWFDEGAVHYITAVQNWQATQPWPHSTSEVRITSPSSGAKVSGTVTIGTQLASDVHWENTYVDGHYLASSPPTSLSWNSASVADGTHTISATAFGSSGASLGSTSISV